MDQCNWSEVLGQASVSEAGAIFREYLRGAVRTGLHRVSQVQRWSGGIRRFGRGTLRRDVRGPQGHGPFQIRPTRSGTKNHRLGQWGRPRPRIPPRALTCTGRTRRSSGTSVVGRVASVYWWSSNRKCSASWVVRCVRDTLTSPAWFAPSKAGCSGCGKLRSGCILKVVDILMAGKGGANARRKPEGLALTANVMPSKRASGSQNGQVDHVQDYLMSPLQVVLRGPMIFVYDVASAMVTSARFPTAWAYLRTISSEKLARCPVSSFINVDRSMPVLASMSSKLSPRD